MKIYIAGPMRGIPYYNFPAFDHARDDLLAYGHEVVSPADLDRRAANFEASRLPAETDWSAVPEGFDLKACCARDLEALLTCDAIYMLPGWQKSRGAMAEWSVAVWRGLGVMGDVGEVGPAPVKASNPKDALGVRKVPFSVLPWRVLHGVALAMLEGACKYGRHNYRAVGVRASVYFDAAVARHLSQWWEGEDLDADSGVHHVDKAMACLMVLRDSMLQGNPVDDRPMRGGLDIAPHNARAAALMDQYQDKQPHHYCIGDDGAGSPVGDSLTARASAAAVPLFNCCGAVTHAMADRLAYIAAKLSPLYNAGASAEEFGAALRSDASQTSTGDQP